MILNRRHFLAGSALGALGLTIAPGIRVARALEPAAKRDLLVVIFLRGGADGLHLVAPVDDPAYRARRPSLALSPSEAIALQNPLAGVDFRLHPAAEPLKGLYDSGDLAIIHSTGLVSSNRSHFVSQDMMERGGADGETLASDGWLARHLLADGPAEGAIATLAAGNSVPTVLSGAPSAVSIPDPSGFTLEGGETDMNVLRALMSDGTAHGDVGLTTLDAIDTVQGALPKDANGAILPYQPPEGIVYGGGPLAAGLMGVAQLLRADVGIDVATVDFGGWDTHDGQAAEFAGQAEALALSLNGFYSDLKELQDNLSIVVMSEFGRRVAENGNQGTEHGSGGVMLALGGGIEGGRMYGDWRGLAPEALDNNGQDLAVTTDFRQVLAELLVKRRGSAGLSTIFPTLSYQPLGFARDRLTG